MCPVNFNPAKCVSERGLFATCAPFLLIIAFVPIRSSVALEHRGSGRSVVAARAIGLAHVCIRLCADRDAAPRSPKEELEQARCARSAGANLPHSRPPEIKPKSILRDGRPSDRPALWLTGWRTTPWTLNRRNRALNDRAESSRDCGEESTHASRADASASF